MERLTQELRENLFSYLDEDALWECRSVCSNWKDYLDESPRVDLYVGNPEKGIWKNHRGRPFAELSFIHECGIRRCFMSQVDLEPTRRPLDPNLKWKNPGGLQYLWIDGFIRPQTLNHLTRDLVWLHSLELHWSALDSGIDTSEINLDLPNLELFRLTLFSTRDVQFKSLSAVFRNIMTLLDSLTFPRLESVHFSVIFAPGFFRPLNSAMLRFIHRNAKELDVVQLTYDYICSNVDVCEESALPEVTQEQLMKVLYLEELRIICVPGMMVSVDQIDTLISSQFNLIKFYAHINPEPPRANFLSPIHNGFQTLTKIQMVLIPIFKANGNPIPVRLTRFGHCQNLRVLELVGPADRPNLQRIQDLRGLPKSLRVISLANFRISVTSTMALLKNKPNLTRLRLFNAGQLNGLGIPVDLFLGMVQERQIKFISLTHSINEESLATALAESDTADPEVRRILTKLVGMETVSMELNLEGDAYLETETVVDYPMYPDGEDVPEFDGFHFLDFFGAKVIEEEENGEEASSDCSDLGDLDESAIELEPEEEWENYFDDDF